MLKKTLFLILALIVVLVPVSAGGSNELVEESSEESQQAYRVLYNSTDAAGWMNSIADVFDDMTTLFCVSLTPYPGMLGIIYGDSSGNETAGLGYRIPLPTDIEELGLSDILLTSDGYYMRSEQNGSGFMGTEIFGTPVEQQRKSWNMITLLFVAFLLAEIIFSTIYGYMTDRDGGILKDVVSKAVLCMLLFLLAASLPFLIEAFRIGFVEMARTLTGISTSVDGNMDRGSRIAALDTILKTSNIFRFPGLILRNMIATLTMMNPSRIAGAEGLNIWQATDTGTIGKLVIETLYIIIKIVSCIIAVFTALHVLLNVCEVYLLLGIVSCLLPFAVFSPTKWIGQNAVKSLISNTLELFIILVIIFASFTMTNTVITALEAVLTSSIRSISLEVVFTNQDTFQAVTGEEYPEIISEDNSFLDPMVTETDENGNETSHLRPVYLSIGSYDPNSNVSAGSSMTENGYINVDFVTDSQDSAMQMGNVDDIGGIVVNAIDDYFRQVRSNPEMLTNLRQQYAALNPLLSEDKINEALSDIAFVDLPANDKMAVIRAWEQANTGSVKVSERGRTLGLNPDDSNNYFVIHILTCLLCVFLQTYFINQSSHIMNAILTGGVANESLSAAAYRLLFPKVMSAVTFPVRAAAGIASAASSKGGGWASRLLSDGGGK